MAKNYVFSLRLTKIYSALFEFIHNGHFTLVVSKIHWIYSDHVLGGQ